MPFGKQYEDTYWHGDDGEINYSLVNRRHNAYPSRVLSGSAQSFPALDRQVEEANDGDIVPVQGILFHPATGTGLKEDPTVPAERRIAAVDRALGLDKTMRGRSKKDAELLRESLDTSAMPTHVIESIEPTDSYLKSSTYGGGKFWKSYRSLMVGRQSDVTREVIEPRTVLATRPSKTPIFNSKFSEQFGRRIEATELFGDDIDRAARRGEDIQWRHPETGEILNHEEAIKRGSTPTYGPQTPKVSTSPTRYPETYDSKKHGPLSGFSPDDVTIEPGKTSTYYWFENMVGQGFQPNLFFGKGIAPDNPKIHSNPPFRAERDIMNVRGEYPTTDVHTRFVPDDEMDETVIPRKVITHRTPYISQATLIHELGHATDAVPTSSIGQVHETSSTHVDPMSEGRADGYADRFAQSDRRGRGRGRGRGDELALALAEPQTLHADLQSTGYGTRNKRWKNDTMRALYAVSRIESRLAGQHAQHSDRETVLESLGKSFHPQNIPPAKEIDRLTLGHMWENNPQVRPYMPEALLPTAQAAHAEYLVAADTHSRNRHNEWVRKSNSRRGAFEGGTGGQRPLTPIDDEPPTQLKIPGF